LPLTRTQNNPIITRQDIPELRRDLHDVSSVFNPGATRWRGRELLVLRVQTRARTTVLLAAERQPDGAVQFLGDPLKIEGLDKVSPAPAHVYDPRLTVIDDILYMTLACDFAAGCHLLTAKTTDFERWEFVALEQDVDQRNGALFPELSDGQFLRLQRPNDSKRADGPTTGSAITLARSPDLKHWTEVATVMAGRPQRWDEWIGSGPPPVKTREGWLHIYHGVATHFAAANIYQAGVVLLDLDDPSRVVARGAFNILEPREPWELTGQVPNVVFPSGLVVDDIDDDGFCAMHSSLRVYYGAADTVIGLATATIAELIADAHLDDDQV
jgi:predicted GH43/DUF377 family glycosyl hydrolase